jgi:alpha-beta hydrolase superfamily lysophospholipase
MNNCQPARFSTPKGFQLDGLYFEAPRAKRAIIFVHGLGGSMFWPSLVYKMAEKGTSLLTFNNRGHDKISFARQVLKNGKSKRISAGSCHENFTDCADDIQGAVDFCRARGSSDIFLVGHSTGCQKSVYYLSHAKDQNKIAGAVLLCPVSDYADALTYNKAVITKAEALARKLVRIGKEHQMLPEEIWPGLCDAQRFLSLYTPDSKEEIFCYATNRRPITLQKVTVPLLAVFAENDEYLDRPLSEITSWFVKNIRTKDFTFKTVKDAVHMLHGREKPVLDMISDFVSRIDGS